MIIVHGGRCQGQETFAEKRRKELAESGREPRVIADFKDRCYKAFCENEAAFADMESAEPGAVQNTPLFRSLTQEAAEETELILVTEEIGSGIIPLEKRDRVFRESYGRLLVSLAKEADEVYRVICGIAQRLK